LLRAFQAGQFLLLPAFERPPLMGQGLEAVDQATEATAGNSVRFINNLIQITDQAIHLL